MYEQLVQRVDRLGEAMAEGFAAADRRLAALAATMADGFAAIDQRFTGVDQRLDEFGRHMRVLHEETIERLAALPENPVPTRTEMRQADDDLRESVERRLDPLEAVVRNHSRQIERLNTKRR